MIEFDPEYDNGFVFRSRIAEKIKALEKETNKGLEEEILKELVSTKLEEISLLVITGKTL